MRMGMIALAAAAAAAACLVPQFSFGQRARGGGGAPQSAEAMYKQAISEKQWKNDYTGEEFAWQTNAGGLRSLLRAYDRTKDESYLDFAVKFYDDLLGKMQTGPDGYKGFIGPFEYTPDGEKPKYWCDDHVGDALMFDGVLEFSVKVMGDPKLKEKYGAKALEYVESAKKNFFEKWDARGTYRQDGPYAFYVGWDKYGAVGELKDWKQHPESPECVGQDNLSLPFNKDIDCGAVAIRIWQVTGDEKFKHRAEQLFGYMKSRMQNYNGAYHWNYWDPTGQWDLGLTEADVKSGEWNPATASKTMRHWTAVHPHRNYQSNEIGNIALAYNAGIVFTEEDIKGMIHTNLKVMWNGDKENPRWGNSNIDLNKTIGKPEAYHAPRAPEMPGELWSGLTQFDAAYQEIGGRRGGGGEAPSLERKLVKGKVEIPAVYSQFPLGNVRTVQMACVLPSIFPLGSTTAIDCKLIEPGELEVALYSANGKNKIATLKKGNVDGGGDGRAGVNYILFNGILPDGKTLDPGDYRVRWTVTNDGYREFPITVQPKK